MGDQEAEEDTSDNCPCKRQRLRQGTEASDDDRECAFSELASVLANEENQEPGLSREQQVAPDESGDRAPACVAQHKYQNNGKCRRDRNQTFESRMGIKTLDRNMGLQHDRKTIEEIVHVNESGGDDTSYMGIKVLSFGEYDLETGEMTEHPVAGKNFHHIKHLLSGDEEHQSLTKKNRGRCLPGNSEGTSKNQIELGKLGQHSEAWVHSTKILSDKKIQALAENTLIGSLEKSKFGGTSSFAEAGLTKGSVMQQNLMEESESRVMPPEYLTDSGFIDMFSNDKFISEKTCASTETPQTLNPKINDRRPAGNTLFRIKPKYLTSGSEGHITQTQKNILSPSSFIKRKQNGLFDIDTSTSREVLDLSVLNSFPPTLILEIFKFLTPYTLLRKVSLVCKYWYNLSRMPGLWRSLNLQNQHKLTDEILEQLLMFSERILHVNLTDCRSITDEGAKAVLTRCRYIQTLKLMRCFDLKDGVFEGLGLRKLCRNLSALHLDGCFKITDRTVLEVAEACKNLKILHLNQCNKVTDTGIIALARNCPKLRQLLLDHCDKVTDAGAVELVRGCPDLVYLNFMSCGVSDVGVRQFAMLKNLNNLDLSNIPRLTPGPVIEIARSCHHLECINISLNSVMNDDCVSYIAKHCQRLKRLYSVSCHITDKGLEDIAKYCPTVEALDVGWCQDITDHGVRVISHACKHLDYFGLIRCDKVTLGTIEELVLQFPGINYSTFILESRRLLERSRQEGFQYVLEDAVSLI